MTTSYVMSFDMDFSDTSGVDYSHSAVTACKM